MPRRLQSENPEMRPYAPEQLTTITRGRNGGFGIGAAIDPHSTSYAKAVRDYQMFKTRTLVCFSFRFSLSIKILFCSAPAPSASQMVSYEFGCMLNVLYVRHWYQDKYSTGICPNNGPTETVIEVSYSFL